MHLTCLFEFAFKCHQLSTKHMFEQYLIIAKNFFNHAILWGRPCPIFILWSCEELVFEFYIYKIYTYWCVFKPTIMDVDDWCKKNL
jgi:hypothetical protein